MLLIGKSRKDIDGRSPYQRLTRAPGPDSAHHLALQIKFYWNTDASAHKGCWEMQSLAEFLPPEENCPLCQEEAEVLVGRQLPPATSTEGTVMVQVHLILTRRAL